MKLVQITTVPESLRGFLSDHIAYLKQRGFEVHAISSPGEPLDEVSRHEAISVHPVPMARRITPLKDLAALWRMYRTLCKLRPEIVHAHTPKAGLLGSLAAWMARVPVRVYTIHGLPMLTAKGAKRFLLRWSERIACLCASQVLCVSPSVRQVAVEGRLCPGARIKVLGHGSIDGVDAAVRFNPQRQMARPNEVRRRYGIGCDDPVIGFVGRIVRDKGLVELVAAWQVLRGQLPQLHLLLVGPFEPQDPLPAEVVMLLKTDARIHLAGEVREVAPYYAAMDVMALPSYREGLGNVLLEAAAMQLPTVATEIPGCRDAVEDGLTGLLVPPYDAVALADALRLLLSHPLLRRHLGLNGRARVLRDFRPEVVYQAHYDEYVALLRENGLSAPAHQTEAAPGSLQGRRAA